MGDPTGYLDEGKGLPWITMDSSRGIIWCRVGGAVQEGDRAAELEAQAGRDAGLDLAGARHTMLLIARVHTMCRNMRTDPAGCSSARCAST